MNEWNNLPNAAHIDRILASMKSHPTAMSAAWSADRNVAWSAAWSAASDAAMSAAWSTARDAARSAARSAAWSAASDAAKSAASDAAWSAAMDAIASLIAWDNSAKYLDMSSDHLKVWMHLSDDPAAVLILPAVIAFEKIKEMEEIS